MSFHLQANHTVVLFADLQAGIIDFPLTQSLDRLRRSVAALAELAMLFEMPTIVTVAPSEGPPKLLEELPNVLGAPTLYPRTTTDAFTHAPTRNAIEHSARKTLLIAGVATEIIVQHSALSAAAAGFDTQVVVDACGGLSSRTEEAAFRRLSDAGVTMTSIASVAGQLAGDFTRPQGAKALGVLYKMASG